MNRWLRIWKIGPARKTPPRWVERLSLHLQEQLVTGYADADGWRTDDGVRVASTHLEGLLSLRRILARLGRAASIRKGAGPRLETLPHGISQSQQKYDLRWSLRQDRYQFNRTHIADAFLWSKVRAGGEGPSATFASIRTGTGQYVTHFGLSHDRDDIEPE
jgi:LAGLIDADG-like domain